VAMRSLKNLGCRIFASFRVYGHSFASRRGNSACLGGWTVLFQRKNFLSGRNDCCLWRATAAYPEKNFSGMVDASPFPRFLPGPVCIRGGAVRQFASDWLLHRGIHPEASRRTWHQILTRYQRLTATERAPRGFHCGFQASQQSGNPPSWKPPCNTSPPTILQSHRGRH
jgi:hypothetical protein